MNASTEFSQKGNQTKKIKNSASEEVFDYNKQNNFSFQTFPSHVKCP